MSRVDILLSTYNGERYLRELLGSVFGQSFTDWRLIVRDDGSQDKTSDILQEYHQKYPGKIVLMPQDGRNLGPCASFGRLMEFSSAPYVMFCDQDDVWLKEKVGLSMGKIMELEERSGRDIPLLVYTNSFVTDEKLRVLSDATQWYRGIGLSESVRFRNLILRNVTIGNNLLFNRSLVKLSSPVPQGAFMHDWWVGIVAAAFGKIGYVPEPTVFYRQHGKNVCSLRKINFWERLMDFSGTYKDYMRLQIRIQKQIESFYERFGPFLSTDDISLECAMAAPLADLGKLSFWKRKGFLLKFYKNCPYRIRAFMDLFFYYKIL